MTPVWTHTPILNGCYLLTLCTQIYLCKYEIKQIIITDYVYHMKRRKKKLINNEGLQSNK